MNDLDAVVDLQSIKESNVPIGVDPLAGASVGNWDAIGDRYGLNLNVVNRIVDPTFRFMTVDWDGQIRMDPSSPYAMTRIVSLKDRFDVALASSIPTPIATESSATVTDCSIRTTTSQLRFHLCSRTDRGGRRPSPSAKPWSVAA